MRILFFMFITLNAFGCPKIKGILIDACGTNEERNEWMVLTTDVSVSVNSLIIDYDINNNSGGSSNVDIGSGGCTWITPRTSSMDAINWIVLNDIFPKNYDHTTTIYHYPNPNVGNYYRLKETDLNGDIIYSDIYYKKCEIDLSSFELFNMLGQKVYFPLPKGVYIKKYINFSEKIIIN